MCDCLARINDELRPGGHILNVAVPLGRGSVRALISLVRRDRGEIERRRGQPKDIAASFCPFCGEPYQPDEGLSPDKGETEGRGT